MLNKCLWLPALAGCFLFHPLPAGAADVMEDFTANPLDHGWVTRGDASLFRWNSSAGKLAVTWDSSTANSYFARPLGGVISDQHDFGVTFDLLLEDFQAGINPAKPNPFQLAAGFVRLEHAVSPSFARGSGADAPNLVEFSFFPDPGGTWIWGPSLMATMIDWTGTNWSSGGFAPLGLTVNEVFRITLSYTAADRTLRTTLTRGGILYGPVADAQLGSEFRGFQVDHFAICSYSDAGQDPFYSGSIIAHGQIDNISIALPLVLIGRLDQGVWQATFSSKADVAYYLERTTDWATWVAVAGPVTGNGGELSVTDPNPPADQAFYRVRAGGQ